MDTTADGRTVGAIVKDAREARGLSASEAARETGVLRGLILRQEWGGPPAPPADLRTLAASLGLSAGDLLLRAALERAGDAARSYLAEGSLAESGYRLALLRPDGSVLGAQDLATGAITVNARSGEVGEPVSDDDRAAD